MTWRSLSHQGPRYLALVVPMLLIPKDGFLLKPKRSKQEDEYKMMSCVKAMEECGR